MFHRCIGALVGLAMMGMAGATSARATLIDRGLFDDGFGNMISLIYEDDQDVTWLGDPEFALKSGFAGTGGTMFWDEAVAWADSLTVGGFNDWRLPTTLNPDPTCSNPSNGGQGFNCIGGEMGHLYYLEGITFEMPGLFENFRMGAYWTGTEYDGCSGPCAWIFKFDDGGIQDQQLKT